MRRGSVLAWAGHRRRAPPTPRCRRRPGSGRALVPRVARAVPRVCSRPWAGQPPAGPPASQLPRPQKPRSREEAAGRQGHLASIRWGCPALKPEPWATRAAGPHPQAPGRAEGAHLPLDGPAHRPLSPGVPPLSFLHTHAHEERGRDPLWSRGPAPGATGRHGGGHGTCCPAPCAGRRPSPLTAPCAHLASRGRAPRPDPPAPHAPSLRDTAPGGACSPRHAPAPGQASSLRCHPAVSPPLGAQWT